MKLIFATTSFLGRWIAPCLLLAQAWPANAAVLPAFPPDPEATTGATDSFAPTFSRDGRSILFLSTAHNLVANDSPAPWLDVFLYDVASQQNQLISVGPFGSARGNQNSHSPTVSSNGQFLAWASAASNLAPVADGLPDDNNEIDILFRDRNSGAARLVSIAHDQSAAAQGDKPAQNLPLCVHPLISADGAMVAFESFATNLTIVPDTNRASDVFCWHAVDQTNHLVTISFTGAHAANRSSSLAGIATDGRRLLLISSATDLVADATNGLPQVVLFEHASSEAPQDRLSWISHDADASLTNQASFSSALLSEQGNTAVFKATLPGQTNAYLFHYEIDSKQTTLLTNSVSGHHPVSVSANGERVAYDDGENVWLWDKPTAERRLITQTPAPQFSGQHRSHSPTLTPDGLVIGFLSQSTALATNDTRGVVQAFRQDLGTGETQLISVGAGGAASRSSIEAFPPALSSDGFLVAFESRDATLVDGDFNAGQDVFLRNVTANETRLVSHRLASIPSIRGGGVATLTRSAVSRNGHWVAYVDREDGGQYYDRDWLGNLRVGNLQAGTNVSLTVPDPLNPLQAYLLNAPVLSESGRYLACRKSVFDTPMFPGYSIAILWFDLMSGDPIEIDLVAEGNFPDYSLSATPDLSPDGRYLAFHSQAYPGYFVPSYSGGFNASFQVYLADLFAEEPVFQILSVNTSGTLLGYNDSTTPRFSPDAAWVVFQSFANNLTTNIVALSSFQLYSRHLPSQTTRLVSYLPNGSGLPEPPDATVFSGNSRYVCFQATPSFTIYRHELPEPGAPFLTNDVVCTNCWQPSPDVTGNLVAFATRSASGQVYVRNMGTEDLELISVNTLGQPANGRSTEPQLSPDGRFVLFSSSAGDLVQNDSNNAEDVFLRDRLLNTTFLLSRTPDGNSGNFRSANPVLSGDGRTAVFRSFAHDLVPGDFNLAADLFFVRLSGEDSDMDGVDDVWEVIYFDTLGRDGSGDFDEDGRSDADEYKAGTDPTDENSLFRVLTLQRTGGGDVMLLWASALGKAYQVEYTDSLEAIDWRPLPGITVADGATASKVDVNGGNDGQRYYRVRLLD